MRGNGLHFGASKTRTLLHASLKPLKISDFSAQRLLNVNPACKRREGRTETAPKLTENAETSVWQNNIFTVQGINRLMGKLVKRSEWNSPPPLRFPPFCARAWSCMCVSSSSAPPVPLVRSPLKPAISKIAPSTGYIGRIRSHHELHTI